MGMIGGELLYNSNRFIDLQQILPEAAIVMLDHQRRNAFDGFEQNTEAGKRLHEVAGWDKLIPESMPQYQLGSPAFRLASMPSAEVRLWSSSGLRRRHPALVAPYRLDARGPAAVPDRRADLRLARRERRRAGEPHPDGRRRRGLDPAEPRLFRPCRRRRQDDGALSRRGEGAEPRRDHLRAAARRRHRDRGRAAERHHPAEHGRAQRRTGRRDRGLRRGRRLGDRHGRDLDRDGIWRRARRLRARSAVRGPSRGGRAGRRGRAEPEHRDARAAQLPAPRPGDPGRGLRLAGRHRAGARMAQRGIRSSPAWRRPTPCPSAATCRW